MEPESREGSEPHNGHPPLLLAKVAPGQVLCPSHLFLFTSSSPLREAGIGHVSDTSSSSPTLAPSPLTRVGQRGWGGKLRGVGAKREWRTFAQKQEKSPTDDAKMGSFSPPFMLSVCQRFLLALCPSR